jgi:hypothetical protein
MRYAKVMYGFAGAAALAAGVVAWLLLPTRTSPQLAAPASAVTQEPASQQENAAGQSRPVTPPAETRTPSAVFEARFKASREKPRPPPDPAILNAPTFAEAFQAMKQAESRPAPAENAGANPFGTTR